MTNCPNCGAVITGPQCEYCDTVFYTISDSYTPVEKLKKENEFIERQVALKDLYTQALMAMKKYAWGGD